MTEEKKPFTVSDRRHFTAEGETRSPAPEETPAPPPPPPAPNVEKAEMPERNAAPTVRTPEEGAHPRPAGGLGGAEHPPAERASEGLLRDSPSESRASASSLRSDDTSERAGGLGGAEHPPAERASEGFTPERAEDAEAPPMDFIGLLVSLATQAGYLMSPEPGSGAPPDLAGARSIIALLEILKQKTEGRRTPDEDRVLDGLLYELRMAFVSRTRPEKA
ncbi:MAG: hypothetical protein DMF83_15750 [Acidobacteria bacterium]|nr:MAG: hypothetical protein DMF83_15750 [Acidobacteriota bacterium]